MSFENLPGIFPNLIDGNLQLLSTNSAPAVVIIGTAPQGPSEALTVVTSPSEAAADFGKNDGTLIRGMYEALQGGATNIQLYRMGAKSATLTGIGAVDDDGITVTTSVKDDNAGTAFLVYWDDTSERLRIYRESDDLLVYDNNPAYPAAAVDEFLVEVDGETDGNPGEGDRGDIGTLSAPVTLLAAGSIVGITYTAGDDGINLSRIEMYEELFKAYKNLENEDMDVIVPMNVFLDDRNVQDMDAKDRSGLAYSWSTGPNTYPLPGSYDDVLGKVFAQEYDGEWLFWWDFEGSVSARAYPDEGDASPTEDAEGETLLAADFHDVNFGYQLANFCYTQSEDNEEMTGVIGMLPPTAWTHKGVSVWIGKLPTTLQDGNSNTIIDENGEGLLGNKWMVGRRGEGGEFPGHRIGGLDGLYHGGFIGTDTGWLDDTQEYDRNDHLIDIGKYISVVPAQAVFSNPTSPVSYVATGAPYYGGFYSALAPNSAPTNKIVNGLRIPFRINASKLDTLAGQRYVMFQTKSKGNVVADAPTAARPDSDYRRLSTMRIVKACVDAVRAVGDGYIGEAITGARLAGLETAISGVLVKLMKLEYIQRYDAVVTSTPTQQVLGQATVELVIVPAFELRQITVNVALAAK